LPGGASWILASLSSDQRARASGSPSGFLALIVRLVVEISMGSTLPHWWERVKQRLCYVRTPDSGLPRCWLFPWERYSQSMAAKNKIKSRTIPPVRREDSDLRDLMGLHFQASRRVEEVLEQIQELRSAGKLPEALALQMHAKGIQQGLRALEAEVRRATRASLRTAH
jgi:hypothetical protein